VPDQTQLGQVVHAGNKTFCTYPLLAETMIADREPAPSPPVPHP
jgi:hypothetical protein